MLIWGVTSGAAGMNAQVDGVGEALTLKLGATYVRKTFTRPLGWLPGTWTIGCKKQLTPPFPDVVISCGRRSVAFALTLKKLSGCKLIHLQDPRVSPKLFDLVVAQEHDGLKGDNIITTFAAMHSITPEKLGGAAFAFPVFKSYPNPRVAVLLGGDTNRYKTNDVAIADMVSQITALKGSLMITPSRRTPSQLVAQLKAALTGREHVYLYEGVGENPYLALLAYADEIAVTNDSVSMMSEAAYTGKQLTVLPWQGHQETVPATFAEALVKRELGDERAGVVERIVSKLGLTKKV